MGFTLLEVLLSIAIFSIIGLTLFASFNSTVQNIGALDQTITDLEMGRNCLDRIVADLRSIYVAASPLYAPPDFDDSPEPYRIVGDFTDVGGARFSRLRFTSFAHLSFEKDNRTDIAQIVYYVHATKTGDLLLRRSDGLYPYPEFEEKSTDPVLCDRVQSLRLTYFDQENQEREDWDSDSDEVRYATPLAVRIDLTFGDNGRPMRLQTTVALAVYREMIGKTGKT